MRPTIGMAVIALLAISGCDGALQGAGPPVKGSGVTKEETRDLPAFDEVEVNSTFEAKVVIGPVPSVTLNVEENLLPLVKTEVKDGRLFVSFEGGRNVRPTKPTKVDIVVPSLDFLGANGASKVIASVGECKSLAVESGGASSIEVDGLASDSVGVKANGSSRVILKGRGVRLAVDASGASSVVADDASFESANANLSGASRGKLKVTGSIEGDVSGASSLTVRGNPSTRNVGTSGASSVSY